MSVSEVKSDEQKPFVVVLEKYKSAVVVNSIDVSEDDDCLLTVDFNHDIDAPQDEVAEELGRVILQRLEEGVGYMSDNATVEVVDEEK